MYKYKKETVNNKIRISLILITMNRKDVLENCLRSLQKQTFSDMEIIVVDNASSDGTGDMVRRSFPDVRYYHLNTNLGPTGGRNYGVRMSAAELCVFLDDDAVFTDGDALNRVVSYFRSGSELGCIAFRIVQPSNGCEEYKCIPRVDKKIINEDYECSYFCGGGFACRRSLFLKAGMFWEPLFYLVEELDLSYRLVNQGCKILRSSAISVIHYETPQGRIPGKWIYYGTRNHVWVALRNLPWPYAVSHIMLWCGYYFISSVKNRHPVFFLKGVKDALIGFPKALQTRTCVANETVHRLKKLSGRAYY